MKIKDILLGGLVLFSACLLSCQDDELISVSEVPQTITRNTTDAASGLTKNAEGYWVASRRVPLVGEGRMVNDYSNALITALGTTNGFDNMLDTDLDNATYFGGVQADLLGNQIASVVDLNRVYAGGQTAGFVYKAANDKLLSATVLKGFWLKTFLNGEEQEVKGGKTEGELLELNLLGAANNDGKQSLSISTSFDKPFDEIKIGIAGVDAEVLSGLSLYYAFVGDNEVKPCTKGSTYFPDSKIHYDGLFDLGWTDAILTRQAGELVDSDLDNGVTFGTLAELLADPYITVDLGKEIPAGSEIGFYTSDIDVLSINLGDGVQLTTYDKNDKEVEEVTINSLLGISAVGGGKSMISMVITKPCSQIRIKYNGVNISLGATTVHYAFVKDPIVVDPSSYFSLANDKITGNSYQFLVPESGKVTWNLKNAPEGANASITSNGKLIGMTVDGDYVVEATYTYRDDEGKTQTISQEVTVKRENVKMGETCDQIIDTENYGARVSSNTAGGNVLEILSKVEGVENLVDNNRDNYANYSNVLSVIGGECLASIKTETLINENAEAIKTGFVMETNTTILGADVLKFFVVKLYKDGKEMATSLAAGSEVADVGLIGSESKKMRVGFKTNVSFNQIELWHAGALNLNLKSYKLYYAYWEKVSDNCVSSDPAEACIELLTPASYGAEINYAETKATGVANIGASFNNLSKLLDSDKESYATVTYTEVIGKTSVAVRFNEMFGIQRQIGFIVSFPEYLADVNLLAGTKMSVYYHGNPVASSVGHEQLLDVQLIGYSDKYYFETTIPRETTFDEVRIELPAVAGVSKTVNLFGVYTRRDSNENGIPDCSEEEDTGDKITYATAESEHVCYPKEVDIQVAGGKPGTDYTLICYDVNQNNKETKYTLPLSNGRFTISYLPVGDYYIRIQEEEAAGAIHVMVHPTETTWKVNAVSTDWNQWNNWDRGIPWECTNVIIPTNAATYPVLDSNDKATCLNIHFEPGAELIGQSHLHYTQAFVDMNLSSGAYHLMSAPLQAMVTGDMFVTQNVNDWETWRRETSSDGHHPNYFMPIDGEKQGNDNNSAYIEQRNDPFIYQRFWSSAVRNETLTRAYNTTDKVITELTDWSRSFNAVETNYEVGQGFALKAGDERNATLYHFHFPKSFSIYHYYGINGNSLKGSSIARTGRQIGRLWTAKQINELTLKRETSGTLYIFGNPFMAHINIKKFLEANSLSVSSVKVYKDGQYVDITSSNVANGAQIAPMQAVFLTATEGTSLRVTLSEDMLEQGSSSTKLTREMPDQMRLTATSNGHSASCTIVSSSSGNDKFNSREDVTLLVGSEEGSGVAVYTIADGKALSIQRMKSATRIPVGFYLKQAGNVNLAFDASDDIWNSWRLKDQQTGRSYPLKGKITLDNVSTGSGRFFLEKVQ
jgi:hypothetical protein